MTHLNRAPALASHDPESCRQCWRHMVRNAGFTCFGTVASHGPECWLPMSRNIQAQPVVNGGCRSPQRRDSGGRDRQRCLPHAGCWASLRSAQPIALTPSCVNTRRDPGSTRQRPPNLAPASLDPADQHQSQFNRDRSRPEDGLGRTLTFCRAAGSGRKLGVRFCRVRFCRGSVAQGAHGRQSIWPPGMDQKGGLRTLVYRSEI